MFIPKPTPPKFAVCKFDEYKAEYKMEKFMATFHEFDFVKHGITQEEI